MKLPAILASDLHLTANPVDDYRWALFPWLVNECKEEKAQTLLLLGDLTDAKDYHPGQLVNRVVQEIQKLRAVVPRIVILKGNHDQLKDGHMFFEFLRSFEGVEVITRPTEDHELSTNAFFLPYSKNPMEEWKGMNFEHYDYLFMHQTVAGAKASNGQVMDGETLPELNACQVYSGDIHVPQMVGRVEYVGSPYHVHFGDNFVPRCIAIDRSGKAFDLEFKSPARVMMNADEAEIPLDLLFLKPGDHVKVRVTVPLSAKHQWKAIKAEHERMAAASGVVLQGIEMRLQKSTTRASPGDKPVSLFDPVRAVYSFVEREQLGGELLAIGLECLEAQA